jgi:hypothetical protein
MTRGTDGDSRGKVQKQIAIHILQHRTTALLCNQGIKARVRRRGELLVCFDDFPGQRPGKIGVNVWNL